MYTAVQKRIEEVFQMRIQGKRYNHYRDLTNWKPFHFDSAALDKDAAKGKGKGGGGGKGGGRPHMCESQNMTVGVSFGEARQAAFEWAGAQGREPAGVPDHLLSPAASHSFHKNVVLSLTVADGSTYGRDVNLLWRHGILAEKPPSGGEAATALNVEGHISIIAWGWVDQYDGSTSTSAPPRRAPRRSTAAARPRRRRVLARRRAARPRRPRRPRRANQSERPRERSRRARRDGHRRDDRGGGAAAAAGAAAARRWRDERRDERDHGGFSRGIDVNDPDEIARREARAAGRARHLPNLLIVRPSRLTEFLTELAVALAARRFRAQRAAFCATRRHRRSRCSRRPFRITRRPPPSSSSRSSSRSRSR